MATKNINGVDYSTEKVSYGSGKSAVSKDFPYTMSLYMDSPNGTKNGGKFYIDELPPVRLGGGISGGVMTYLIQYFMVVNGVRKDYMPSNIPGILIPGTKFFPAPVTAARALEAQTAAANQDNYNALTAKMKSLVHQAENPLETLKNMCDNLSKYVKKGLEYSILLPFMPTMLATLTANKAKIKNPTDPEYVAKLFYSGIIYPRLSSLNHVDDDGTLPETPEQAKKEEQAATALQTGDALADGANKSGNPYGMAAGTFLKMIIAFMRGMQKKKKKQPLSKDEKDAGAGVTKPGDEAIADNVDKAQDALAGDIGKGTMDSKGNIPVPEKPRRTFSDFVEDALHVSEKKHKAALKNWASNAKMSGVQQGKFNAAFDIMSPSELDTMNKFVFDYDLGKNNSKPVPDSLGKKALYIIYKYKLGE